MISPQELMKRERRSAAVLGAIRRFIDGLRSAPNHTLQLQPATSIKKQGYGGIHFGGSLLTHLNSIGAMQQVNGLHDDDQQQQHLLKIQNGGENFPDARLGSLLMKQDEADERKHILFKVIVPLLSHLEQCYGIMDELPPSTSSAQPSSTVKNNSKNKAPPPPGMLSLNDYTNVACLLEFAVSISLIPLLEHPTMYLPPLTQSSSGNNTQFADKYMHKIDRYSADMSQKRYQSIPKSLAGRISKMILAWGTLSTAVNHTSLYDNLREGDYFSGEDLINLRQSYQFYRIFQTYNEVTIVAISVGRLILLDRFRPMLLPRHLSDVYLALLISERLRWYLSKLECYIPFKRSVLATLIESEKRTEQQNHEKLNSLQMSLLFRPIPFPSSVISTLPIQAPPKKFVDSREAALAYRTLLIGGASMVTSSTSSPGIPNWLRIRLGQCLTKLAQEDVRSVIEVFVASARGPGNSDDDDDVMTGAAARLACALCTEPMSIEQNSTSAKCKTQQFQKQIWSQFVRFLVVEGQSSNGSILSRSSVAIHLTLWATIGHLSLETLQSFFVRKLVSGLIPVERANSQEPTSHQLTAIQSISALANWLSMIPSSLDVQTGEKIKILLLEPCTMIHDSYLTIIGQVLRLASYRSLNSSNTALIEEVGNSNVDCSAMRKVELALAHILAFLCRIGGTATQSCNDQFNIIALELLKSLSSNELDREGFCFDESEVQHMEPGSLVYRRSISMTDFSDSSYLIESAECRVKCLVRALWRSQISGSEASVEKLVSSLFRIALLLHYERFADCDCNDPHIANTVGLNNLTASEKFEMKMAASITLAAMTESCPPSFLLGCGQRNSDSDSSLLEVLGLIIRSAAARLKVDEAKTDADEDSELFSTVSIVLSLLVAMLELGAEKRSRSDEAFFEALIPFLLVLSSVNNDEEYAYSLELTRSVAELAEMASHAMALIVARGEVVTSADDQMPLDEERRNTRTDDIFYKLSQAERDLKSTQPPIRAKGVVALRHIARSLERRNDSYHSESSLGAVNETALITDVSVPASKSLPTLSAKDDLALISITLARICLNVLADPESYVYLASIQTLVAIGDVCPSQIMPLMGAVIAEGRLSILVATAGAKLESEELSLSPEQRIKAVEALIFMIRRRGDGIFLYGSLLLSTMLFRQRLCRKSGSAVQYNDQTAQMIQKQTHLYFTGGDNGDTVYNDSDERKVRLNTGGPIFSMEESDLLRAGAISVVCELVSTLNPVTIASYCHVLVKMAIDAMLLDTSRPVRRVVASLARDLYACVMREISTLRSGKDVESSTFSMTIAIVDANEEQLYNLLTRCVSGNELAKNYLADPSTQCRSQEAIEIRQQLESMGVFRAAAAVLLERSKYPESIIQKLSFN